MSPDQQQLVKSTWRDLAPNGDAAARRFYDRLLNVDPSTGPLFAHVDMARQSGKLAAALTMVVNGIHDVEALRPHVEELGRRHLRYGVRPSHYEAVGSALLSTLAEALSDRWTPEVEAAWSQAYGVLVEVMLDGVARGAPATMPDGARSQIHAGQCFCGEVQIEVQGEPEGQGYCHCASCRAWSAAPVTAFTLWKPANVRITSGAPRLASFAKTSGNQRRYCDRCGGHVMTNHPDLGLVDVFAAMLPTLAFNPTLHINYAETVLRLNDGLPKLRDFPAELGGSGELVD